MKKGFIKENWGAIIVVLLFTLASVYMWDLLIIVVTVIFAILLGMNYKKYDEHEQAHNDWWNALTKAEKLKVYETTIPKEKKKEVQL